MQEYQKLPMSLNLIDDCIFIADTHFNEKNTIFYTFLQELKEKRLLCKQLILMGDMFDFLTFETKYFIKKNQKVIDLLNDLSKDIEIIYFEGNHDYNLKKIFPLIKIYERQEQPVLAEYKNKSISLSHGDMYIDNFYNIYCSIIRNKTLLALLNILDINDVLSKKIYTSLLAKSICRKIPNFKEIIQKKIDCYNTSIVIEGHYHQGDFITYDKTFYVNIPSLLCSNEYVILNDTFKKITLRTKV